MVLAACLRSWPDELRADFQQFYGLNLDDLGRAYTVRHAACLAAMLPRESRVMRAACPDAVWGLEHYLLAIVANAANDLVWLEADPRRRQSTRPKPIQPPMPRRETDAEPIDADDYLAELARLRGGAHGGD